MTGSTPDLPMDLPIIDLDVFLQGPRDSEVAKAECAKAARALITYGALVLHDSRVSEADNATFLDLLEDYFAQPEETLRRDERPKLGFQVGVTLENTEKPKCAADGACLDVIRRLAPEERPLDISAHNPDPKCRFFWRMADGVPPYETQFPALNAENVVPADPAIRGRWTPVMEKWGRSMKSAVSGLAEMAAVGLGLPASTFTDAGQYGPHLLAPTASDLVKYGEKDTILAGFHTDLNFMTIHGRSRYPGLRSQKGITFSCRLNTSPMLPDFRDALSNMNPLIDTDHEVVVNQQTLDVIERRKQAFLDRPLVRISSTFFWHLSSDFDLAPIPALAEQAKALRAEQFNLGRDEGEEVVYEPMKVGQQVQNELKHIELMV
ncbi:hypothetical protein DL766_002664 [Monosporascus sp. MC13-8B]|uniref:Non-haem dioxygenase N-terminal domain-containing protein n=1 Tax=Monosporascus cannonballus TaxID=155416 RepID=A0ABY0GZ34_9PEZI|nr:hypothetical protein DL762_007482 [Monosporascus cannonballus]RYO83813.1 hypothetical protein DL763_007692 [Monosporascus cannonballus]RYP35100.1 hypothetical protein DL766_002664 [Monosporascus sp. MC13-8B]